MSSPTDEFRVIVCGGRDFHDREFLEKVMGVLLEYSEKRQKTLRVMQGGAAGADLLAWTWELKNSSKVLGNTFYANWSKYGPSAGPIRNKEMLKIGKPNLVVAFLGGVGTADMTRQAQEAGVPIWRPRG